jgi:hypothetical protein
MENNNDPNFFLCVCGKNICSKCNWGITGFPPKIKIKEYITEKKNFSLDNLDECIKYYQTDKSKNGYTNFYLNIFKKYNVDDKLNILEIGVARGSSLKVWSSIFKNSNIYGIDINKQCVNLCSDFKNIKICIGNINDNDILTKYFPNINFDIIIDDGSHLPNDIINSFNKLFYNKLNNNGIYIIEDCGPSYSDSYKLLNNYNDDLTNNPEYLKKNSRERFNDFIINLIKDVDFNNNNIKNITIEKHIISIKKSV